MDRRQAFQYAGLVGLYALSSWAEAPKPQQNLTPEQIRSQQLNARIQKDVAGLKSNQLTKRFDPADVRDYKIRHDAIGQHLQSIKASIQGAKAKFTQPKGR